MINNERKNEVNDLCFKISNDAIMQADDILLMVEDFKSRVTYYEYGIAGTNLHRGWYSPSLIEDHVLACGLLCFFFFLLCLSKR